MAFTVETGAIIDGANSLLSVAEANTYHTDRGNAAWSGADSVKQAALIKATDYITQKYGSSWAGRRTDEDQSLDWPRYDVYDENRTVPSDEIPKKLKQAVAMLALDALSSDLNPNLDRGGAVKREKVDVIETEYMDWAPTTTLRPAIDGLLRSFMNGTSPINAKLTRA